MRWFSNEKQFELSNLDLISQLQKKYRKKYWDSRYSHYYSKSWQYLKLLNELYDKFNHSKTIPSKITFSESCSYCKRKNVMKLFEELGFKVIRYEKIYGRIKVSIVPL